MSQRYKQNEKLQSWIDLQIGPTQSNGEFEPQENPSQTVSVQARKKMPPPMDLIDSMGRTVLIRQKVEGWLATFFLLFSESEVRTQARKLNAEIKEAPAVG